MLSPRRHRQVTLGVLVYASEDLARIAASPALAQAAAPGGGQLDGQRGARDRSSALGVALLVMRWLALPTKLITTLGALGVALHSEDQCFACLAMVVVVHLWLRFFNCDRGFPPLCDAVQVLGLAASSSNAVLQQRLLQPSQPTQPPQPPQPALGPALEPELEGGKGGPEDSIENSAAARSGVRGGDLWDCEAGGRKYEGATDGGAQGDDDGGGDDEDGGDGGGGRAASGADDGNGDGDIDADGNADIDAGRGVDPSELLEYQYAVRVGARVLLFYYVN